MIQIPTSNDIFIEVNGTRLAVAQGYSAKTTRDSHYVEAFGSGEPVGTVGGRARYRLELSRVVLTGRDGIDFHGITDFNVVIVKPDRRIIYSGCAWAAIDETATLGNVVLESVSIVASKRMELT